MVLSREWWQQLPLLGNGVGVKKAVARHYSQKEKKCNKV
jgi:hypothetical protein